MTVADSIRVLVVDDDFHIAELHRGYVSALPGFEALPAVGSVRAARSAIMALRPDLVLLDVYLPDGSGLDLMLELEADVYVLSAAADGTTVRRAFGRGALGYLIKPFDREFLLEKLRAYARYRNVLSLAGPLDQEVIERGQRILHSGDVRGASPSRSATEQAVLAALQAGGGESSASDVASFVGISRATAQRYLAQLASAGSITVQLRYGAAGRPEHRYQASTH